MKVRSVAAASVVGVMMSVAHAALAVDYEFTWDAANPQTSFGDGLVTLTLDESTHVTAMTVDAIRGDTVTFRGDPMTFAADAQVSLASGILTFANDLAAEGVLKLVAPPSPDDWQSSDKVGLLSDVPTIVAEGFCVDDIEVMSAYLNNAVDGDAAPYFPRRGEGWLEVQLQQSGGVGKTTKVVKIRLEQSGEDVVARIVYAKYVLNQDVRGVDFDDPPPDLNVQSYYTPSSTSVPGSYYGCNRLTFAWIAGMEAVKVSGAFACGGQVRVAAGLDFELVNQSNVTLPSVELPSKAQLVVSSDANGPEDTVLKGASVGYVPAGGLVFAAKTLLDEIDFNSVTGMLAGSSLSTTPIAATVCFGRWNDAKTAYVIEFQANTSGSSYAKGVALEFVQEGADVVVRPSALGRQNYGLYYQGTAGSKSYASGEGVSTTTYASSYTNGGYCAASVSADFKEPRTLSGSQVTLNDGGLELAGRIIVRGADAAHHVELIAGTDHAFPTNGTISVEYGGVLNLGVKADMYKGISGGNCQVSVGPGGRLLQGYVGSANMSHPWAYNGGSLVVDGGVARFGCWSPSASSSDRVDTSGSCYLNFLTLKNGALCTGRAVRFGNQASSQWNVTGSSPSTWDADISLLALYGTTAATVAFAVEDVSDDETVDFTVTGSMRMFSAESGYQNLTVRKTGEGTMKVNGVTDFTVNPLQIVAGTWMVGSDTTMSTAQNIQLNGGAFASADGVSASVGKLLVGGAGGGIVAGANATVSFLDSSDQTWLGTVNITCPEGSSVRFGTSASALTAAQQRKLRLNGKRAVLSDDGTVEQRIGTLLILR